jgi:hypothetical protein
MVPILPWAWATTSNATKSLIERVKGICRDVEHALAGSWVDASHITLDTVLHRAQHCLIMKAYLCINYESFLTGHWVLLRKNKTFQRYCAFYRPQFELELFIQGLCNE